MSGPLWAVWRQSSTRSRSSIQPKSRSLAWTRWWRWFGSTSPRRIQNKCCIMRQKKRRHCYRLVYTPPVLGHACEALGRMINVRHTGRGIEAYTLRVQERCRNPRAAAPFTLPVCRRCASTRRVGPGTPRQSRQGAHRRAVVRPCPPPRPRRRSASAAGRAGRSASS